MRKETEQLVLQARRDLENARKVIDVGAFEVAAFLSHQAVEKFLKAAWTEKKRKRPPATHSLVDLGEELGAPQELAARLRFLNPDYTVARYPDAANGVPYKMYDEASARSKVEAAEQIREWAETLIR